MVLRGAGEDFCIGRAGMGCEAGSASLIRLTRGRKFSDVVFAAYSAIAHLPIPDHRPWCRAAHTASAAPSRRPATSLIASDKARVGVWEMAHQIMPTMVLSSFVDRVPRKAAGLPALI